jgi:hypothetical protein
MLNQYDNYDFTTPRTLTNRLLLQRILGIGRINVPMILAKAGDMRRSKYQWQFLKFSRLKRKSAANKISDATIYHDKAKRSGQVDLNRSIIENRAIVPPTCPKKQDHYC